MKSIQEIKTEYDLIFDDKIKEYLVQKKCTRKTIRALLNSSNTKSFAILIKNKSVVYTNKKSGIGDQNSIANAVTYTTTNDLLPASVGDLSDNVNGAKRDLHLI